MRLKFMVVGATIAGLGIACSEQTDITQPAGKTETSSRSVQLITPGIPEAENDIGGDRIHFFRVAESFFNEFVDVVEVDLDVLPIHGTSCPIFIYDVQIPNPILLDGTLLADPECILSSGCANPDKKIIILNNDGTLDFPVGTRAALISLACMGEAAFEIEAVDATGSSLLVTGLTTYNGVHFAGFASPNGISRIRLVETPAGGFGIAGIWYAPPDAVAWR